MTTESFKPTERTRLERNPRRGVYDKDLIYEVLDEALLCHVSLAVDGQPFVLPTIHTRVGDFLYLHGSNQNRMLNHIANGATACVSITILDGLVLARSGLHHSMNYRSVVLFAQGE
ncbi:MAG: pyridoxamine 5'-phosphate oxidase family protein, partial [Verrucomicrobiota bacterium]